MASSGRVALLSGPKTLVTASERATCRSLMIDNCLICSRKTSRCPIVPVIIMPVRPAIVISWMLPAKSCACRIAVSRLTALCQAIMPAQASTNTDQMVAVRRSQIFQLDMRKGPSKAMVAIIRPNAPTASGAVPCLPSVGRRKKLAILPLPAFARSRNLPFP